MFSRGVGRKLVVSGIVALFSSLNLISIVLSLQASQDISSYGMISSPSLESEVTVIANFDIQIGTNSLTLGVEIENRWSSFMGSAELQGKAKDIGFGLIRIFTVGGYFVECIWDSSTHTGTYDWTHLDSVMQTIYSVGAEPFICLDIDRMSGMSFDSDGLPSAEDAAQYAKDVTNHVRSKGWHVKYWEIFNEPYWWAFDIQSPPEYKLEKFVNVWNIVAKNIHDILPNALCGTDASGHKAFLDYFVVHGEGVGFLSFHKYDASATWLSPYTIGYISDAELLESASAGKMEPCAYPDVGYTADEMKSVWKERRGEALPVICSEGNLNSEFNKGSDPRIQKIIGAVWYAEELRDFVLRGVDGSIWFCFDGDEFWPGGWGETKFTSKYGFFMVADGGTDPDGIYPPFTEFYPYKLHTLIGQNLAVGDTLYKVSSDNESIASALAWKHSWTYNLLLTGKKDVDSRVYSEADVYVNPAPPDPYNVEVSLGIPEGTNLTIHRIERTDIIAGEIQTEVVSYAEPLTLTLNGYSIVLLSCTPSGQ